MRKRWLILLAGLLVVGISLSGLLGVIDSLTEAEPLVTSGLDSIDYSDLPLPDGSSGISGDGISSGETGISLPGISGSGPLSTVPVFDLSNSAASSSVTPGMDIPSEGGLSAHVPLFTVEGAENTSLLRSTVAATFDGETWKFEEDETTREYENEKLSPAVRGYKSKETDEIKITAVAEFISGELPLPTSQYVTSISSPTSLSYLPEYMLFISQEGMPKSYSFEAVNYYFEQKTLDSALTDPQAKYLQIPSSITARTKALAKEITQGISSPCQQARAIEKYLKENYTYDFDYQAAPEGTDPNDWFLFEEKKGICTNFNSAFVILVRCAGLPARLVGGYAIEAKAGEQEVCGDQAHAWAEVKFKDEGWITFDATGSGGSIVLIETETIITDVEQSVQKGQNFSVKGTVTAKDAVVEGVLVELYINTTKSQTGGTLIGKGLVSGGTFDIDIEIPESINVGNYQLLAHAVEDKKYMESWSDPQIKITSGTKIVLDIAEDFILPEKVIIEGTLEEDSTRPVGSQIIYISLNGKSISQVVTGTDGQFQWEKSVNSAGDYTIKAEFKGSEYYLPSSEESEFQVLVPTAMTLQIPQKANAKEPVIMAGLLRDETSGAPVAGQQVELILDEETSAGYDNTDDSGYFRIEYTFDKDAVYPLEFKFAGASYYGECRTRGVIQILPAVSDGRSAWFIPVIIAAVFGAAGGGFFFYRRRKREHVPVVPAAIPEASVEPKEVLPAEEEVQSNNIRLSIEFPGIESLLPDVWGINDEFETICRLVDGEGVPLADKTIQISLGEQNRKITSDSDGAGRALFTIKDKGSYRVTAGYESESGVENATASRVVRMVDYREEIVDLYNELSVWVIKSGIPLSQDATPREFEGVLLRERRGIPAVAVNKVVRNFEEADYSLHLIKRGNYKETFFARKEMKEYERKYS